MKFLKNTDWGEVWLTSADLSEERLKKLSFNLVSKLGCSIRVISLRPMREADSKEMWDLSDRS